jgi:dTDP-4-amino-4,6-dideoxygalactose transaminase
LTSTSTRQQDKSRVRFGIYSNRFLRLELIEPNFTSTSVVQTLIPFNSPEFIGNELVYVAQALSGAAPARGDDFPSRCERWIESTIGCQDVHLVQSATSGLELAFLAANLVPGDEVILPSFTFVSCANAIALRGAIPVFAEVDARTLLLDPIAVEAAITKRTRAILAVHYAGVPCDMTALRSIADRHQLLLIEDAAQALLSSYRGRCAGSLGDIGVFSFHHTKNVSCGEGGVVLINNPALSERVQILYRNGTNRAAFDSGAIQRYTWLDLGSSYAPSDVTAAVLLAQLERAREITGRRRAIWQKYYLAFETMEAKGRVIRPVVPDHVAHNGHLFYLLMDHRDDRDKFIERMRLRGIETPFHYVPLHTSPGGLRYAERPGQLPITESVASRLVRLPLWPGMATLQDQIIEAAIETLS